MRRVEENQGAGSGGLRIACATLPISPAIEPLSLLRALPDERQFLWQCPGSEEAVAAVGEAVGLGEAGPGRLRATGDSLGPLLSAATRPDGEGPVAVGGFSFDPDHREGGDWAGFASSDWCIPRIALVRREGHARLVAAERLGTRAESVPEAEARLGALLDRVAVAIGNAERDRRRWEVPSCFRVDATGSADRFREGVDRILRAIAAGEIEKAVLARTVRISGDRAFDPISVAARLLRYQSGATVLLARRGSGALVGASPERLVRLRDGRFEVSVLAGSARRGGNAEDDARIARILREDPKELHEHEVVLRSVRAALATTCRSIENAARPTILRTPVVQHLWTPVSGTVAPGCDLFDLASALHPTPAVCGFPGERAAAILSASEPEPRGWWSGGAGWCDARGGEVTVVLRSALLRGAEGLLHAGAGIVAGSHADTEVEETRLKLRPMLAALLEV